MLHFVIIRINATITPKRVWGCHPCCRPELGSGSGFFELDSELTNQDIMLEEKFMNYPD